MNKTYEILKYHDPCGDDAPDKDDFESILYVLIANENYELMDAFISARYFGMKVVPSEKFGRELTNYPPFFDDHFHQVFYKYKDLMIEALTELAKLRAEG